MNVKKMLEDAAAAKAAATTPVVESKPVVEAAKGVEATCTTTYSLRILNCRAMTKQVISMLANDSREIGRRALTGKSPCQ